MSAGLTLFRMLGKRRRSKSAGIPSRRSWILSVRPLRRTPLVLPAAPAQWGPFQHHPMPQGAFKNGSRRREEADFGVKNTSASLPRRLLRLRRFLNVPCPIPVL